MTLIMHIRIQALNVVEMFVSMSYWIFSRWPIKIGQFSRWRRKIQDGRHYKRKIMN